MPRTSLEDYVESAYLTMDQAAKILGVSPGRVWQFVGEGKLPAGKVLGRRVVRLEDVQIFARTRCKKPGPVPGSTQKPRSKASPRNPD